MELFSLRTNPNRPSSRLKVKSRDSSLVCMDFTFSKLKFILKSIGEFLVNLVITLMAALQLVVTLTLSTSCTELPRLKNGTAALSLLSFTLSHVGDLGNISADSNGVAKISM